MTGSAQPSPGRPSSAGITHSFESEAAADLRLVSYHGEEQLGRPYWFEIYFLVENSQHLDPAKLVGKAAKLTTDCSDFDSLQFHGVVSEAGLVEVYPTQSLCVARLEPQLSRAALSKHTRVFVDVTVPELLKKMFGHLRFTPNQYELPSDPLTRYGQITQFEESDLDFITRWLERVGLHYYFDQTGDPERIVVVSGTPDNEELDVGELRYGVGHGAHPWGVSQLRSSTRMGVGAIAVSIYDHQTPLAQPEAGTQSKTQSEAADSGSELDAAQGTGVAIARSAEDSVDATAVEARAKLVAQIDHVRKHTYAGATNAPLLSAGRRFRLDGHPHPDFDCAYYVTRVQHRGSQACSLAEVWSIPGVQQISDAYAASFRAIRAHANYRLEPTTAVPRIHGIRSAVIDGPVDEDYAQLDDQGRYLVRLLHDEERKPDGSASMRVRMLQPSAGNPEGFHLPLRKGTEVMLVFLDGDPDRPLIAGAVPNAVTPSPVTSSNRTLNVLHTGGDNHFELEDAAGAQHIQLKTPAQNTELYQGTAKSFGDAEYNLVETTDGTNLLNVGSDRDVKVGGSLTYTVGGDRSKLVHGDEKTKILGDVDWTVHGEFDGTVHDDYTLEVKGDYDVTHKNDTIETYVGASSESYLGAKNENFFGILNSNSMGLVNENFYGDVVAMSYAVVSETFLGAKNENFFGLKNENFMGAVNSNFFSDTHELRVGNALEIGLGGRLNVELGQAVDIVMGGSLSCEGAAKTILHVGLKVNIALAAEINLALLGISISAFEISATGFKIDRTFAKSENDAVSLSDGVAKIRDTVTDIFK